MSVDDLPAYLKEHWPTIRAQLLEGAYKPQAGTAVEYQGLGRQRRSHPTYSPLHEQA